jgi:hypothetical protein
VTRRPFHGWSLTLRKRGWQENLARGAARVSGKAGRKCRKEDHASLMPKEEQ